MGGCELTEIEFENLAKKVADQLAGHNTLGTEFMMSQCHSTGELIWRMYNGDKAKIFKYLDGAIKKEFFVKYKFNDADKYDFYEWVCAYLFNQGIEVEWKCEE